MFIELGNVERRIRFRGKVSLDLGMGNMSGLVFWKRYEEVDGFKCLEFR